MTTQKWYHDDSSGIAHLFYGKPQFGGFGGMGDTLCGRRLAIPTGNYSVPAFNYGVPAYKKCKQCRKKETQ